MSLNNEEFLFESEAHEFSLVEGTSDGDRHFYIRGKFATIETLNTNKRVYPRALWEREVAKYQSEIENGSINTLMEWEHPQGRLKVDPKNAVAKITKLWIEGDYVMGEAVIFDNPQAETIKSMIRHGVKISVSSRASGSVGSGGIVKEFNLITFDIVTNPSDKAATMGGVFESEEIGANEEDEMADKALMENLVGILRTKNVEIQDLNEEIELLRAQLAAQAEALTESAGEEGSIMESKLRTRDLKIEALNEEIDFLRNALDKYETLGVGSTDRAYSDDGARGFHPDDDFGDRYSSEDEEYTMRRRYSGYRDHGENRHQDVNATLRDNDPSGHYASGEEEEPRIRRILANRANRTEYVGKFLGGDVGVDGKSGDVLTESTNTNRFLAVPSHLI